MKRFKSVPFFVLLAALLLAAGIAVPSQPAHASSGASYLVNTNADNETNDGFCSLREAILAARNDQDNYLGCTNANPGTFGSDYIEFSLTSANHTITLGATLPEITTGTITINGFNNGFPVTIDGANSFRILYVSSGTLTIGNLTLQNGNSGTSTGGAILNSGILIILKSTFLNNTNTSDGGAIDNRSAAIIANSTFSGNSASYGGALSNNTGTMSIYNSTISGNTATTHGGALSTWHSGGLPPAPPTTNIYNTILANSAAPEDCWNGGEGPLTGSNNIIETTTVGSTSCSTVAASTSDPMLGTLTGSPAWFPLPSTSPAFNTGNNTICAGPPVNTESQNGVSRPQGAACDMGSSETIVKIKKVFKSNGTHDGWILESTETSNTGGTKNNTASTLNLGDDAANRQYRAILSFNTASLPDNAVITKVTLKVKRQGVVGGGNLVNTFNGFMVDIKKGSFGTSALQLGDFKASASKTIGPFSPALSSGWYNINLTTGKAQINKTGPTQIRLRFKLDDNNNLVANILKLYSGNAGAANRPKLMIEYYIP